VTAEVGSVDRHHHLVAGAGLDLVIATGTPVTLGRLIRLHVTNLVRAVVDGISHVRLSALGLLRFPCDHGSDAVSSRGPQEPS
jgi:hypothetical protein